MVQDALAGEIDLIIPKSVSRFARNTVDTLTTIRLLKEHGVEEETLRLIHQYCRQDHVIITTGIWDAITAVRALDPDMRVGYLCKYLSEPLVESAKQAGVFQLCPKASILTKEWNDRLRGEGFSVRA